MITDRKLFKTLFGQGLIDANGVAIPGRPPTIEDTTYVEIEHVHIQPHNLEYTKEFTEMICFHEVIIDDIQAAYKLLCLKHELDPTKHQILFNTQVDENRQIVHIKVGVRDFAILK